MKKAPDKTEETVTPPSGEEKPEADDFDFTEEETPEEKPDEKVSKPSKRSADARIQELVAENKRLQSKVESDTNYQAPPPVTPPSETSTPNLEVQRAVELLKKEGKFIDEETLEKKLQQQADRVALNNEHLKLSTTYNGSDGRPEYDQQVIEEFMQKNGVYNPTIAYDQLYKTELLEWEISKAEKQRKPYVETSSTPAGSRVDRNAITPEKIRAAQETPEGRAWYERNRDKILTSLNKGI